MAIFTIELEINAFFLLSFTYNYSAFALLVYLLLDAEAFYGTASRNSKSINHLN